MQTVGEAATPIYFSHINDGSLGLRIISGKRVTAPESQAARAPESSSPASNTALKEVVVAFSHI